MLQMAKDKKLSHTKSCDKKGLGYINAGTGAGASGGESVEDDRGSDFPSRRIDIIPLPVLSPEEQLIFHTTRLRSTGYSYLSPNDDDAYMPMSKGPFSGHVVLYYAKGKEGWLRGTLKGPARLKHELELGWNWNVQFTKTGVLSVLRLDDQHYINSEQEVSDVIIHYLLPTSLLTCLPI